MPQFDVFRNTRGGTFPLVVDVQAELHASLISRIVVPLIPRTRSPARPITRLNPVITIGGSAYVLLFPLMASVPRTSLGELVGTLAAHRATLIAALDLLITGS
jgi:toxin CcdB